MQRLQPRLSILEALFNYCFQDLIAWTNLLLAIILYYYKCHVLKDQQENMKFTIMATFQFIHAVVTDKRRLTDKL